MSAQSSQAPSSSNSSHHRGFTPTSGNQFPRALVQLSTLDVVFGGSSKVALLVFLWSGRRDSNARPSPWQGDVNRLVAPSHSPGVLLRPQDRPLNPANLLNASL